MPANTTPMAWPLRAWFGMEVFFGVVAILSVGIAPQNSDTNFAWPIKPSVGAAMIGGFYMGVALIMVLALFAKRWEMVRVIVIPAILFTSIELIVTFLHWSRFSVGTLPFNIWFASYLLPPPIFLACYLWQQSRSGPMTFDNPLPGGIRVALMVLGALLVFEGFFALFYPQWLVGSFPFQIGPITARALAGWLVALGAMLLSIAYENDRDRVRVATPFLILPLFTIGLQLARFSKDVNWSHPRIYSGALLFAVISAIGIMLARGDWRRSLR